MDNAKNPTEYEYVPEYPDSKYPIFNFKEVIEEYTNEIAEVVKRGENLSKDDIFVINDLLKEVLSSFSKNPDEDDALEIIDDIISLLGTIGKINDSYKNNFVRKYKLLFLQNGIGILFKREEIDYEKCRILLNEVLKLQVRLQKDSSEISTTLFYLALLSKSLDDNEKGIEIAKKALDLIENEEKDSSKKVRKMNKVTEMICRMYEREGDYENAIENYEKLIYLNIGKYGPKNIYSIYYDNLMKNAIEKSERGFKPEREKEEENEDNTYSGKYVYLMSFGKNVRHRGKTDKFSFIIPNTKLSEPLLIRLYSLDNSKDLLGSFLFDKKKLNKYFLKSPDFDNLLIYSDKTLNKVLSEITLRRMTPAITSKELAKCLIN